MFPNVLGGENIFTHAPWGQDASIMAQPISATLITKNAAAHLAEVIAAALACCDEVLVLDCGSDDATREIAQQAGARVEHQDWLGFGPQKNRCAELATHDWVLNLDADEILDAEAQAAIKAVDLGAANPADGFRIRRRNHVGKREIRYGTWGKEKVLRLYNKTKSAFNDVPIHESVQVPGAMHDLRGGLIHWSYPDLAALFRIDYHRLKGQQYHAKGRSAGGIVLLFRFFWGFFRSYILRFGVLDGGAGVMVAASVALNDSLGLALSREERLGMTGGDKLA